MKMETFSEIIHLNVGGKHLSTRLSTLTKYPDSMLAAMFSGRHVVDKDSDGRYFVDCNGEIFEIILDFLRFGSLPSKEKALNVYEMATYFVIQPLMQALESFQEVRNKNKVDAFTSSASAMEYESLKQKIIAALDSSQPLDTKRILLIYSQEPAPMCKSGDKYSPQIQCRPSALENKYPSADICIQLKIDSEPSKDFLFCLKENLCRLGFGSYSRAYTNHMKCFNCHRILNTLYTIILSSHKLVAEEQRQWKFI